MPFENGVNWQPIDPDKRGRYDSFDRVVETIVADMTVERNEFFESLADKWQELFPGLPIRPGRYEAGMIFLYVRSAPHLYMMKPKLRTMTRKLAALPGAPKKIVLKLEIQQ